MDVQPDQLPLEYEFSQRAASAPRAKTSIAPLVGEVAAGPRSEPAEGLVRRPRRAAIRFIPEGAAGACYKDAERDYPKSRPPVLCRKRASRRARSRRSRWRLRSWWSSPRGRRHRRAQRRRSRQHWVRSRRGTRSETRRGIGTPTTTSRYTFYTRGRRRRLLQRR